MVAGYYFLLSSTFNYILLFIVNQSHDNVRLFLLENLFVGRIVIVLIYALIFVYTKKYAGKGYSLLDYILFKHWKGYLLFFVFFAIYDAIHITEIHYVNSLTETFAVVLFLVLFLHSLKHVKINHQLEITQRELEIEQLYVSSQEKTLNSLRMSKQELHVLHKMMHEMLKNGEHAKLDSIMEETTVHAPQTISLPKSVKKIPVLIGILLEKVSRAEMQGIKFEIAITDEYIDLKYCSNLDYCRIMSIFLDNALEAAAESKDKTMKLLINVDNGKLQSIITNSCDDNVDINRIYDHDYNTKNPSSGEGLYQVRLYQSKYEKMGCSMEVKASFDNGYFTIVLTI